MTKYLYLEKRQRVKKDKTEISRRAERIKEELEKKRVDFDIYHFDEVGITFENGTTKISLANKNTPFDYSHIIFGGHTLGTNEYELKKLIIKQVEEFNSKNPDKKIKVQNHETMKRLPFYSKFDFAEICMKSDLPHLATYYSPKGDYVDNLGPLSYPVVAKHIDGENDIIPVGGKDNIKKNVFLIKHKDDWKQERLVNKDLTKFFIQEFTDIGEDYRIFLTRNKVIGGWRRVSPETNFITVSKGAEYFYYNEPNEQMLEICKKAQQLWNFDFLALDFIYKDGKPYILEFSLHPGFHAYETKCLNGEPANIAKAIVDAI